MTAFYPAAPTPPDRPAPELHWQDAPDGLRPVVVLLLINLTLAIVLTAIVIFARNSIVSFQLDHRHITDPQMRNALRHGYLLTIMSRVVGNIVLSIVYAFLVRALVRGRRWAYRRVIWLGAAGIVGLVLIQLTPYPVWMRAEQIAQALVLAALLYFVTRPDVRAYFAPHLPGRNVRRFHTR